MATNFIDESDTQALVRVLNQGGIIALPTDTVYGLVVRYDLPNAVDRLKNLKGRLANKPLAFLVANLAQIESIAQLKERDYQLIATCLPGPVTFLFSRKSALSAEYTAGLPTVAIRMLADPALNRLIEQVQVPLLLTSANYRDEPEALDSEMVEKLFGDQIEAIVPGKSGNNQASTIIDTTNVELLVKRQGKTTLTEIKRKAGLGMKIAIGADHGAFDKKAVIVKHLKSLGHEVIDFGTNSSASVDYPDFAGPAAEAVANQQADLGIVMCGTGIGASITANKVSGIRCALVYDPKVAKITREHNDSNVLALGGRITPVETMLEIVDNWLVTPFSHDQRHEQRIAKVAALEKEQHVR